MGARGRQRRAPTLAERGRWQGAAAAAWRTRVAQFSSNLRKSQVPALQARPQAVPHADHLHLERIIEPAPLRGAERGRLGACTADSAEVHAMASAQLHRCAAAAAAGSGQRRSQAQIGLHFNLRQVSGVSLVLQRMLVSRQGPVELLRQAQTQRAHVCGSWSWISGRPPHAWRACGVHAALCMAQARPDSVHIHTCAAPAPSPSLLEARGATLRRPSPRVSWLSIWSVYLQGAGAVGAVVGGPAWARGSAALLARRAAVS